MVVDIILLQNSTAIVIEVDANLLATVYAISSESWLTAGGDPHACQCVGVNLITFNDATPIVMLTGRGKKS